MSNYAVKFHTSYLFCSVCFSIFLRNETEIKNRLRSKIKSKTDNRDFINIWLVMWVK